MMTLTDPVSDADLREAIEILISESFLAMSIANAVARSPVAPQTPWRLLRTFTPRQLFDEAVERKLPLGEFRAAVGERPITEAPIYQAYLRSKEK